jgi:two-component system sensor histidine kinase PfeS
MKKRLLWKLCGIVAVGGITLILTTSLLEKWAERQMSVIAPQHQHTLAAWGAKAEALYNAGDENALAAWLEALQAQEETWAAVVTSHVTPVAGGTLSAQFQEGYRLGRLIEWPIHLYFADNPIMDITFEGGHRHFLITLPQRMRPGSHLNTVIWLVNGLIPLLTLLAIAWLLYRHIMGPLRYLRDATQALADGQPHSAAQPMRRADELGELISHFDGMALKTQGTIAAQRQLLADLSHEIRAPLTRLSLAIDQMKATADSPPQLTRLEQESQQMRQLVNDALTLAWLTHEPPTLGSDTFDLVDLLDALMDDVCFEYPEHQWHVVLPDSALLKNSSQRALGQALENLLRNACHYSLVAAHDTTNPKPPTLSVSLRAQQLSYQLTLRDNGPGVEEQQLEHLFTPFYRTPDARQTRPEGTGLGLALALRQINAVRGTISTRNHPEGGLEHTITLPVDAVNTPQM